MEEYMEAGDQLNIFLMNLSISGESKTAIALAPFLQLGSMKFTGAEIEHKNVSWKHFSLSYFHTTLMTYSKVLWSKL